MKNEKKTNKVFNQHSLMSLTSVELNYLVWRYLQESGFDLAAFALEKYLQCLSYEHNGNLPIILRIEPGCLVNLVQKGILFTLAEGEAVPKSGKAGDLSLFQALLKDELERAVEQENEISSPKKFQLKSEVEVVEENQDEDVEMEEIINGNVEKEFTTKIIVPIIKFEESIVSDWHPATKVFAYGREDSTAVIVAINNDTIAESVQLNHPSVLGIKNEINIVSWSPQGNLIVTAGLNGELRAWSPDGKLKNIANAFNNEGANAFNNDGADSPKLPSLISTLVWNPTSQFLLLIDCQNQVSLWDGPTLTLIKQIRQPNEGSIDACWLDETNFALSTTKFAIKIYSIISPQPSFINLNAISSYEIQTIGHLNGHENPISLLLFNQESKLLALSLDFDYAIKVWRRGLAQESLDMNIQKDQLIKLHTTPIIGLFWLENRNNDSVLLSVLMEGRANIWNATNGDNIKSVELFKSEASFNYEGDGIALKDSRLVLTASVSPNKKFLAISDGFARVTIWDVAEYLEKSAKGFLRCLGIYNFEKKEEDTNVGVCDLKWDVNSTNVCVLYKGGESVVFGWA